MIYNDCERGHCARCSAKFYIFEQDGLLADLLCGACWWELHDQNDVKGVSSPVNVNECFITDDEFNLDNYSQPSNEING